MTPAIAKQPKWHQQLSASFLVNSCAISNDAQRVVACTYYYPYPGTTSNNTYGTFGTYCFDSAGSQIWKDEYTGNEGVFAVAISGDGKIAAGGGLLSGGKFGTPPTKGLLRAFNAGTGQKLVDYSGAPKRVNSVSLSGDGSVMAAVAANNLYVFAQKNGQFPASPAIPLTGGNFLDSVAVHSSGQWLAACDRGGNVYLITVKNGAVGLTYTWTAPVPIPFLSVAAAQGSETFVVGGGNAIYLFTKASMTQAGGPAPIAQFTPGGAAPSGQHQNVRWVAISSSGNFVTEVENVGATGLVRALTLSGGALILTPGWGANPISLSHNPNCTSIDAAGQYVTACDGEPVGTPGTFHLLNAASGNVVWDFATNNMNWPMFISADGSAIVAGSDNGTVYYFVVP